VISYISGELKYIINESIVVDNNGIGYSISVSPKTISQLPAIGERVCIYTYMSVSESGISLYGFSSMEELDLFNSIIGVSGIGPKGALGILGAVSPSQFVMAVLTDDIKTLSSAPGIGKKTAQRLVLELKDKLDSSQALELEGIELPTADNTTTEKSEAVQALEALGFAKSEAMQAVDAVYIDSMTVEKTVSLALKVLGLGR
jgi:Holliday junction DNA helicase RuvA